MKNLLGLGFLTVSSLLVSTNAVAAGAYQDQPLRFHCNVSTRVVAGDLNIGFDPLMGYLVYDLDKFHATDTTQTYKKSGSLEGTVKFENQGRTTLITATSRLVSGNTKTVKLLLSRCGLPNEPQLQTFEVNGIDEDFQGLSATCQAVN